MTWELKRVPLGPVVRVAFLVFFLLALVLFLLYSTVLMGIVRSVGDALDIPLISGAGGVALVFAGLLVAFLSAFFYTLIAVLVTLFYNAIASFSGGLRLELEEETVIPPSGLAAGAGASAPIVPPPPPPPAGNDGEPGES